MAEVILAKISASKNMLLEIDSAGVVDVVLGQDVTEEANEILTRSVYSRSNHRSRRFSKDDFNDFDLIVPMTSAHEALAREIAPGIPAAEVHLLLEFREEGGPTDVPDPFGGGPAAYERTLFAIEDGVKALTCWLERKLRGDQAALKRRGRPRD